MEADISGPQRKVIMSRVRPLKRAHGDEGIALRQGKSLPFVVSRFWSAPAGHYLEEWRLVHPETEQILLEGPARLVRLMGLQAPTEVRDEVLEAIALEPGTYWLQFSLSGLSSGRIEVEASEVPAEEAA